MKQAFPNRSLQRNHEEYEVKYLGHDGSYIAPKNENKNFCEVPARKINPLPSTNNFSFDPEKSELIAQYKLLANELRARGIDPNNC